MPPQQIVTIPQSLKALECMWSTLSISAGHLISSYFTLTQAAITTLAEGLSLHEFMDWPPPYIRDGAKLMVLLRCIKSYMSRGNIETSLDAWITKKEGPDAGNKADVREYLRGLTTPAEDTVTLSINLAGCLISALEYLESKVCLASLVSGKYDNYNGYYIEADLLQNQVIRGTRTKADALKFIDEVIYANDECYRLFRDFIILEPNKDPYEGCKILLGRNSFNSEVKDTDVTSAISEGRDQNLRVGLRTLGEEYVPDRRSIPFFEKGTST